MSVYGAKSDVTTRPFTSYIQKDLVRKLATMKPVTPESLSKGVSISGMLMYECKNNYQNRGFQVLNFSPEIRHLNKRKMRKNSQKIAKSEKIFICDKETERKGLEISYSDFKRHHSSRAQKRPSFMAKRKSVLEYSSMFKKPVIEPIKQEEVIKDDLFIKNILYNRPALTYPEKLFRLSQVSIFN